MIHALLLLLVVVSSCQPKKRGVICGRVDVNSGQCTTQLSGDTKTDDPPELPEIPTLPPKDDDPLTTNETQITTATSLKDIVIKSKCLAGQCRYDLDVDKYLLTCTAKECNQAELFSFDKTAPINVGSEDESLLCADDYTHEDTVYLRCGIADIDNLEIFKDHPPSMMLIDNDLLKQGVCVSYTQEGFEIKKSMVEKPAGGCEIPAQLTGGYYKVIGIVELTFSLKQP